MSVNAWYSELTTTEKMNRLTRELEELANKGRDISSAITACNDLQYTMRDWLREANPQSLEDDEMIPDAIQEMSTVLTNVVLGRIETVNRLIRDAMRELQSGNDASRAYGPDQSGHEAVVAEEEGHE